MSNENNADTLSVTSSNSSTKGRSYRVGRRRRKSRTAEVSFHFDSFCAEGHRQVVYSASFNNFLSSRDESIFATVGSNRCSIYSCPPQGGINLLLCYADPDAEENFYTCAWTCDGKNSTSLLTAAGLRGIIRVIDVVKHRCICNLVGHGAAINQLKIHPTQSCLILSCSKDYAIRLWNFQTQLLIAIFGGVEGHRAEVLTVDFDLRGQRIMSGGMDHAMKMWRIDTEEMKEKIELSKNFYHNIRKSGKQFPTVKIYYPDFTSRDIHGNYVDCLQWYGDFIISKSCQNSIAVWKIQEPKENTPNATKPKNLKAEIITQFKCDHCEFWFVRFDFNVWHHLLAVGNKYGQIFVYEFSSEGPAQTRTYVLSNKKCNSTVRHVTFSKDARILIAVCDNGTVWRWNKI